MVFDESDKIFYIRGIGAAMLLAGMTMLVKQESTLASFSTSSPLLFQLTFMTLTAGGVCLLSIAHLRATRERYKKMLRSRNESVPSWNSQEISDLARLGALPEHKPDTDNSVSKHSK